MSLSTTEIASGGFGYAPLTRGLGEDSPLQELYNFSYPVSIYRHNRKVADT